MLDKHLGKIVILILTVLVLIFAMMFYNSNKKHQQYLEQEITKLKSKVEDQESTQKQNQKQLLERAQKTAREKEALELLKKQAEVNKIQLENEKQLNLKKEKQLDKKLDKIETVVTDFKQQQDKEKELRTLNEKMSKQALSAAYISQGLQTATMIKMMVAEFYMSEGTFPNSNEELGLPRANSYNSDTIRSIWVSKGGKITVVYKQITGQDKGAISLIPNEKNNQLNWKCMTRDFKNIQQFIPQCKYSLSQ
jgi:Ca2+/Na+ antiporter